MLRRYKWFIVNFFWPHKPKVYRRIFYTRDSAVYAYTELKKLERMLGIYQGKELKGLKLSSLSFPIKIKPSYEGVDMIGSLRVHMRKRNRKKYGEIYHSIVLKGEWQYPPKIVEAGKEEKWRKHCRRRWKRNFLKFEGMTKSELKKANPPPKDWWPNHKRMIPDRFSTYLE